MKIIFSTDTIQRGGKERQLFVLTKALLDKGYQIKIITKKKSSDNYISEYGFEKNLVIEINGKGWVQKFQDYKKKILSYSPDIVISWDFQTSLFPLLLYKKCNFKFINASIQHGIRLFRFSQLLRSFVCHLSPRIIANSYAGLKANNLKPGKHAFVLYNGIENKFNNPLKPEGVYNKRTELIPGYLQTPGIIYISVANLVPYKDYFTVLKALNKLKDQKSFYYFIIGDGPMREKIVAVIKEYGLEKRVIMTGKVENVSDYLFVSDIMIHSSRGEGISNAILEGIYAGLPIIATSVGGVPETVFSDSSLMFPYKDDKALLECLLKAPEVFTGFDKGSEEYNIHLAKFSVETMVKSFEEIIRKVFNGSEVRSQKSEGF
jgi:glycosyltransferase involved in cell wall biosynthesis